MDYTILHVGVFVKVPDRFADALRQHLEDALAPFAHSEIGYAISDPRAEIQFVQGELAALEGIALALGLEPEPAAKRD